MVRLTRRQTQRLCLFAAIALIAWGYNRLRHQEVVGWTRWDTLNREIPPALAAGDLPHAEGLVSAAHDAAANHQQLAASRRYLGLLRLKQSRFDEAEKAYASAIDEIERFAASDEVFLALLLNESAAVSLRRQRPEEALARIDRSIDLSRRALGPKEATTVQRMRERAAVLLALGRVADAAAAATRATEVERAPVALPPSTRRSS